MLPYLINLFKFFHLTMLVVDLNKICCKLQNQGRAMPPKSSPLCASRRQFLLALGAAITMKRTFELILRARKEGETLMDERPFHQTNGLTLSLCGDVMTGRGIDQVLPHPSPPRLHEPYVTDARRYVELSQKKSGGFEVPLAFADIWGDALAAWEQAAPDLRIVNLETSITQSEDYWPYKDIHYRMNPNNLPCLTAAKLDCCCLANNHVLDWGYLGLEETLASLRWGKIKTAGAGLTLKEAEAPATFEIEGRGRVLVFSMAAVSSGIPWDWAATPDRPGINLLPDLSAATAEYLARQIAQVKRPDDLAIASIHWGGNWGYKISNNQREFAHHIMSA
jgi:poly-gamma-glutamate synthesis protein (capsule biosynthesis protein)